MRFINAVDSTMQPSIALAPPASPVPAPRVTTGVVVAVATCKRRDDVVDRTGAHDRERLARSGGERAVVAVLIHHVGIGDETVGVEPGQERFDHRGHVRQRTGHYLRSRGPQDFPRASTQSESRATSPA